MIKPPDSNHSLIAPFLTDTKSRSSETLKLSKSWNTTTVALANEHTRIIWALLAKVAFTTCIRRMITILNAMLRNHTPWRAEHAQPVDMGSRSLVMFIP